MTKRSALAASIALLGHLQWSWIAPAVLLELASLAALAGMQRRLLVAGRARVTMRPMLATIFAANAVSVSVPLAGPEFGTLFTFRRLTRQGADATLASWSLLTGGLVSTATGAMVVAGGGLSSGNTVALAAAAPVALLAVAALAMVAIAPHRPRLRRAVERSAAWALRHTSRVRCRGTGDSGQTAQAWADRLVSLHLPPSGWATVTGLALVNWLTDAAVLAVSIHAAGAAVPWHILLLIYGSGLAAQSLTVTPGGFGVAEGTLGLTLVAAGLPPGPAITHNRVVATSAASFAATDPLGGPCTGVSGKPVRWRPTGGLGACWPPSWAWSQARSCGGLSRRCARRSWRRSRLCGITTRAAN